MGMTVAEQIAEQVYGLVRGLSAAKAAEVLKYVESVSVQSTDKESDALPDDKSWHELLESLSGAWKDDNFPTLEEIRAGEGQDVPRESW
jgi:hypothetical protein